MSRRVDITVRIDGEPVALPAPIDTMLTSIVEQRDNIRTMGAGEVSLHFDYRERTTVVRLLQLYRKSTRRDPLS